MIAETLNELKGHIGKAHEALKRELSRLRTGRASPELLDSIRVDYYGTPTPVAQMASVSVPEPRLLVIKPWDKAMIKQIEQTIMQSPLGLTPQNDGEVIRLPMPQLTEQRRKDLAKLAKGHGEDAKVAIRKARHECRDMLKTIEEDGAASADDVERATKAMEDIVKDGTDKADSLVAAKEKDILVL
jgi:ribosome recycling factor